MTNEPVVAQMRLQYWRNILADIADEKPVRDHEFATPLAQFLDQRGAHLLDDLIVARHWDINKDPFQSEDDFIRFIEETSGNLMCVAAHALDATCDHDVVMDYAFGAGVANWFCAIPALEAAERIPLVDGRPEAIKSLAQSALKRLNRARKNRAKIPVPARYALLSGWQARAILKAAIADPRRVAQNDLAQSEFKKRAALMFQSATGYV